MPDRKTHWFGVRIAGREIVHEARWPKRGHKERSRCYYDTTCSTADFEEQGPFEEVPHTEVNCRRCLVSAAVEMQEVLRMARNAYRKHPDFEK